MAPIGEAYFPPLDRCFDGRQQLVSWKTAYCRLAQDVDNITGPLRAFFLDPQTVNLITDCFSPFSPSNPTTKSSFETRTSAIHVTASPHGRYDIKQIQADTLWLSKYARIDEVAALRIAVIEWQARPAAQILQSDLESELLSVESAFDVSLRQSVIRGRASARDVPASHSSNGQPAAFNSTSRRKRLLKTYLLERVFLLKTTDFLVTKALFEEADSGERKSATTEVLPEGPNSSKERDKDKEEKLKLHESIGKAVLAAWNVNGVARGSKKNHIVIAVEAVRTRLGAMLNGACQTEDESLQEDMELLWGEAQVWETIHIMQITLTLVQSSTELARSDAILSWYRLMADFDFLENFEPLHPGLQGVYNTPMQSLAALTSLALLDVALALEDVLEMSTLVASTAEEADSTSFLLNPAAVNELNDILVVAAANYNSTASPSVLAWSIILYSLREFALASKESRELRQSQKAIDRFAADVSDSEIAEGSISQSLQRRSSAGSDTSQQATFLEEILDRIMTTAIEEDPITFMARSAVDSSNVFAAISSLASEFCTTFGSDHDGRVGLRIRRELLGLVQACLEWIDYQQQIILSILTILTGGKSGWESLTSSPSVSGVDLSAAFLGNELLKNKIFENACHRFPYETLPFLQLCQALGSYNPDDEDGAPAIWARIRYLDTFTCMLPQGFNAYQIVQEDEDFSLVHLLSDLNMFDPTGGGMRTTRQNEFSFSRALGGTSVPEIQEILTGSMGRVVSERKPLVVQWHHKYVFLTYLGQRLRHESLNLRDSTTLEMPENRRDVVAEIIKLITVLLSSAVQSTIVGKATTENGFARTILEESSDGLGHHQDIISVILDLFEAELHRPVKALEEEGGMDILVRCIHFVHALLPVMPDRVWSFLGRSGLIGIQGDSRVSILVASVEMVTGRFDLLLGCIHVFDALVEDAASHAVVRRIPTKAFARFASTDASGSGISGHVMEKVLVRFERILIDVFESTRHWRFESRKEQLEINCQLSITFRKVIHYVYGLDDYGGTASKLASSLQPAANYLLEVFLTESSDQSSSIPILSLLAEGVATPNISLSNSDLLLWLSQTEAVIDFTGTLIHIRSILGTKPSRLEQQIFKATPILVKLYAVHINYRFPVVNLLGILLRSLANGTQQPPSLLGHLGHESASCFLEMLSTFDQPLDDADLAATIWTFFTAVVSQKQQWLAVFLLTGDTPRDSLKDAKKDGGLKLARGGETILGVALDEVKNLDRYGANKVERPEAKKSDRQDANKALCMLEFVAATADNWPWVLHVIEQHPLFVATITDYIARLDDNASSYYRKLEIASMITKILAMLTYHFQQADDASFAKKIIPKLEYLVKSGVSAPRYNASLHASLRKNFQAKFPGVDVRAFKRAVSGVRTTPKGISFYYSLELAEKMLDFDASWGSRTSQGFKHEFARANMNLSLVESQVDLFINWKALLCNMSTALAGDSKFQKTSAGIIVAALKENFRNTLPEAYFDRLEQSRVALAFTLLQHLVETSSGEAQVMNILPVAWSLVQSFDPSLGAVLGGSSAEYYRNLLKILYLALKFHSIEFQNLRSQDNTISNINNDNSNKASRVSTKNSQTILEVIEKVVASGFRSLTALLHDDSSLVSPADFALITAIAQDALHAPGIEWKTAQLVTCFSDQQTPRCASVLLSWSDQLAIDNDPVYGEISILFLLELSTVPALAELMAAEGILSHVLGAKVMKILGQSRSFGPFNTPTRMYGIWSRGVLPLLLNLLHAIGAPIAAEIAAAVNDFPGPLARASTCFDAGAPSKRQESVDYITLGMASEAQTLATLCAILDTFRNAGSSVGLDPGSIAAISWDKEQVKEDIEDLLQRPRGLREKIVPTNEKEERWSRANPSNAASEAESKLEEKVVRELTATLTMLKGDG